MKKIIVILIACCSFQITAFAQKIFHANTFKINDFVCVQSHSNQFNKSVCYYSELWGGKRIAKENNGTPANNYTDNTIGDNSLKGLYYVDDPSNDAEYANLPNGKGGPFPQIHDKKWGFNELELRKAFLCNFLSLPCSGNGNSPVILPEGIDRTPVIGLIDEMKKLKHIPFAKGAH